MIKIVIPKKIIAKPARGKSSFEKACSLCKILANYQGKKEKQTGKGNSSKGKPVFQSNKEQVEHGECSSWVTHYLKIHVALLLMR